jgi:hypothetical protein
MSKLVNRLAFFIPLIACDAPDAEELGADDPSIEFRETDLQCLMPTVPVASTPVVADVVPGELVLFQGHYFAVPGAPANWAPVLADADAVAVLAIGDVVRVVRPQGNYRSKMIATDVSSRLRTVKQGTVGTTIWNDAVEHFGMDDCLDDVERELIECENITEDANCCEGLEPVFARNCALNPFYVVPINAGQIWAETCGPQPIEDDDWDEDRDIEVANMSCTFTGGVEASAVDISNGFLTACSASGSTPTGCKSF